MIGLHSGPVSPETHVAPEETVRMWWLGQAGFLIRTGVSTIVIDPYLSNSLAVKYAGKQFPHTRLMPVPVDPRTLTDVTVVLCTHGHTDHIDPGSLPEIAQASPNARFLVPRSVTDIAVQRGAPGARTIGLDAGDHLDLKEAEAAGVSARSLDGLRVRAVPAAHERLDKDSHGRHLYLGYVFSLHGITFYHSGDTVPFAGQVNLLRDLHIDVALLPINGRDPYRRDRGVPGNMTGAEAVELADQIGAQFLVCHHWGMFDFNTADPHSLPARQVGKVVVPEIGVSHDWTRDSRRHEPRPRSRQTLSPPYRPPTAPSLPSVGDS